MSNARSISDIFSKSTAVSSNAQVSSAIVTERTTVATLSGKTILAPAMTNIIITPSSTTSTPITINGIASQSGDYLNINTLTTGGTNIVKIDVNGNLGLGRTPANKLDVNGAINVSGGILLGDSVYLTGSGGILYYNSQPLVYKTSPIFQPSTDGANVGIRVRRYSSGATANLQEWQDETGTPLTVVSSNGSIGIGKTPSAKLDVNGGISTTGQIQSTLSNNTADGSGQIYLSGATGNRLEFNGNGIATPAFTTRSVGTKIVLFPNVAATTVDYAIGIESANIWQSVPNSTAGFKWYAGQTNIGSLSGTGTFTVTGNVTAYSDERLKSNIKTIDNALEKVSQLRGVSFDKDGESQIGVIAQEVQKVLPEVVQEGEYLSVAYGNIVGLLIEAIKEQQGQIEDLKSRLA